MKHDLFMDANGRLRSGWRFTFFLLAYLFVSFFLILAAMSVLSQLGMGPSAASYLPLTGPFAVSSIVAIVLGWLSARHFEGLSFTSLGISLRGRWYLHLVAGLALGALTFCLAVGIGAATGSLSMSVNTVSSSSAVTSTLLSTAVIFAIGALYEETLFRGYPLQTLVRADRTVLGVVLTSVLFATGHNFNPSATWLSWINTFIAGIWFAAAYLRTRDLWLALGVHFAWNWLQGPVFGISVSGIGELTPDPLLRTTDHGPVWFTGGSYGIEGGVACTAALLVSLAVIWLLPGKAEPPA